jgi:hypothetical protein
VDEPTKPCTGCGTVKPLTEFHKHSKGLMGRRSRCKACAREYGRQRNAANREATSEYNRRYREANPEAILEGKRRYREANREAMRESDRQRYAENREAELDRDRQYREANREALRERGRRYYAENRETRLEGYRRRVAHIQALVFNHYGWRCACCGTAAKLSIDHVNGGGKVHREALFGRSAVSVEFYLLLIAENFPAGYQTLCRSCNASKGSSPHCRLTHG